MSEQFEMTVARKLTRGQRDLAELASHESGYTMGDAIGCALGFPELRGFWPMSSIDESGNARDLSGQGRTLTNNNASPRAVHRDLIPYVSFNGTTQYLSRADEAGLDITGALTIMGWMYMTNVTGARPWISKYNVTGNQAAYGMLYSSTTTKMEMRVSTDGSTIVTAPSSLAPITGAYFFAAGRFTPSTELAMFINNTKDAITAGIPASIFNSNAAFEIGRINALNLLVGRAALCAVCAAALPDALILHYFNITRTLFGV